jgi:hypothetical protein
MSTALHFGQEFVSLLVFLNNIFKLCILKEFLNPPCAYSSFVPLECTLGANIALCGAFQSFQLLLDSRVPSLQSGFWTGVVAGTAKSKPCESSPNPSTVGLSSAW